LQGPKQSITFDSMKGALLTCCLLFTLSISAFAQDSTPLKFVAEQIELGNISKGQKVSGSFEYTNISDESVFIDLVSTCECTDAKWSEEEIKAGESGSIDFIFDTNKKDDNEPVDVDVILRNTDKDGNPFFYYLSYTFTMQA